MNFPDFPEYQRGFQDGKAYAYERFKDAAFIAIVIASCLLFGIGSISIISQY